MGFRVIGFISKNFHHELIEKEASLFIYDDTPLTRCMKDPRPR